MQFLPPKISKANSKKPIASGMRHGMGDYYGSGMKNPVGKIRDTSSIGFRPVSKKQLGTPPKSTV